MSVNVIDNTLGSSAAGLSAQSAANATAGSSAAAHPAVAVSGTGALPPPASGAAHPYPPPAADPTQMGPEGIRFDFNDGCRVRLPPRETGSWRIMLKDLDSGNELFHSDNKGAQINSSKRWYLRFQLQIWSIDEGSTTPRLVMSHDHDLTGQHVLIQFPIGTLGDTLAWFSYCDKFARRHPGAKVSVALSGLIIPLLKGAYPNLNLLTHVEAQQQKLLEQVYATYSTISPAIGSRLIFVTWACIARPATSLASIHLTRRRSLVYRMSRGRLPSAMSASRCKRPRVLSTGITPMAGAKSSLF